MLFRSKRVRGMIFRSKRVRSKKQEICQLSIINYCTFSIGEAILSPLSSHLLILNYQLLYVLHRRGYSLTSHLSPLTS